MTISIELTPFEAALAEALAADMDATVSAYVKALLVADVCTVLELPDRAARTLARHGLIDVPAVGVGLLSLPALTVERRATS